MTDPKEKFRLFPWNGKSARSVVHVWIERSAYVDRNWSKGNELDLDCLQQYYKRRSRLYQVHQS